MIHHPGHDNKDAIKSHNEGAVVILDKECDVKPVEVVKPALEDVVVDRSPNHCIIIVMVKGAKGPFSNSN